MKDFVLDLTYKDAIVINSNDDAFTIPTNSLPNTNISHHTINLNRTTLNHNINNGKNHELNTYNLIDYL